MIDGKSALARLQAGNRRFVADARQGRLPDTAARRSVLADGQSPFAVILGCSDSRVPAELVFDQGLGDLFVIRVAGNVVAPSQVGSVEFAVEKFGTRLVMVLGHSQCGAVVATLDQLRQPTDQRSSALSSIVNRIRPAVETLAETRLSDNPEILLAHAIRANVRAAVSHLRHGSRMLEQYVATRGVMIVGAEYSLETGVVDVFDLPTDSPTPAEYAHEN